MVSLEGAHWSRHKWWRDSWPGLGQTCRFSKIQLFAVSNASEQQGSITNGTIVKLMEIVQTKTNCSVEVQAPLIVGGKGTGKSTIAVQFLASVNTDTITNTMNFSYLTTPAQLQHLIEVLLMHVARHFKWPRNNRAGQVIGTRQFMSADFRGEETWSQLWASCWKGNGSTYWWLVYAINQWVGRSGRFLKFNMKVHYARTISNQCSGSIGHKWAIETAARNKRLLFARQADWRHQVNSGNILPRSDATARCVSVWEKNSRRMCLDTILKEWFCNRHQEWYTQSIEKTLCYIWTDFTWRSFSR